MGLNIVKLLLNDLKFIAKFKSNNTNWLTLLKSSLSPSFICIVIYRSSHFIYCLKIPIIPRLIWWCNFIVFKVDIDQRAKLYSALYLPHPMMVVIGRSVCFEGGNIKIMQGVTIGGNLGKSILNDEFGEIQQPVILGNAFIGINSLIAGPVILRGNIFIASASMVSKNAFDTVIFGNNKYSELLNEHRKEL